VVAQLDFDTDMLHLLSEEEQMLFAQSLETLIGGESATEFINRIAPTEPPPWHIMPIIDVVEQARLRPVRVRIDMAPGHSKTTTLLRLIAWWLSPGKSPGDLCAYVTYSDEQARTKSQIAKEALERSGGFLDPQKDSDGHWITGAGGGLIAKGAGGGVTGKRIPGLLIYDDPYKDVSEARSEAINSRIIDRFKAVAFTRLQGGSIIVLHTRWAQDDLIGYIDRHLKWDRISVPALADEVGSATPGGSGDSRTGTDFLGRKLGEPAWPEKYPYELCLEKDGSRKICGHDGHLVEIRKTLGEHLWSALYQGKPRPLGTQIFHEPARYRLRIGPEGEPSEFAWTGKRGVISVDPAATAKTSADYSVIATVAMDGFGLDARMWIYDLVRLQCEIPDLVSRARRIQLQRRLLCAVEAVGGFKGVGQSMRMISARDTDGRQLGTLRVVDVNPGSRDKFTRAQPCAAAWNDGRIFVPIDTDWADGLIERMMRFTGMASGTEDDEIDAIGQAWNLLYRERGARPDQQQEAM
jgi:predicted phage terminase large subunit-like protein